MIKNFIFLIEIIFISLVFTGCMIDKQPELNMLDSRNLNYETPKIDLTSFETKLITISAKAEKHWKDYYSMLSSRKNLKDENLQRHIPYGMGKRVSIDFEGYFGNLIKQLGSRAGYTVEFQDMNVFDSGVSSFSYHETTIYDIIQMEISKKENISIKIIENEKKIILFPKV